MEVLPLNLQQQPPGPLAVEARQLHALAFGGRVRIFPGAQAGDQGAAGKARPGAQQGEKKGGEQGVGHAGWASMRNRMAGYAGRAAGAGPPPIQNTISFR